MLSRGWNASRAPRTGRRALRRLASIAAAALVLCGSRGTQDAVANGDTRTIEIIHEHTKESAAITFRRNGQYDPEALKQLNWLLRDWRLDEPIRMEPKLFDIVWQVYREVGSREPIHVVSAYRSPETNAALRRRSRAVAEYSQHMLGKAMDFYLPDVPMSRVREIGMRIQNGGVGFYPHAMNPFVHLDAGSVRSWPRMSGAELARLFPDGRTVHMPKSGGPMSGYEEAKAIILARGGSVAGMSGADPEEETGPRKSLWAMLFGGGGDEDADYYRSPASRATAPARAAATRTASAAPARESEDAGTRGGFARRGTQLASASGRASDAPPPGLERFGSDAARAPAGLQGVAAEPPVPAAPMPPRRPVDVAAASPPARPAVLAFLPTGPFSSAAALLPSGLGGGAPGGEMRPGVEPEPPARTEAATAEDRDALRLLFSAVVTRVAALGAAPVATSRTSPRPVEGALDAWRELPSGVRTVFTSGGGAAPPPARFTGPAVAPLPPTWLAAGRG